jgi:HEPN domain-containing protein
MTEQPDLIHEVARWVEKAEHDFLAAEHAMELAEKGLTDIVCFHCQQCAEKYLKALLVFRGAAFPKTHDLRLLWDLIPAETPLKIQREQIIPLNRYVIEGRYPGDWEPITPAEAKQALAMAQAVRQAAKKHLPSTY